MTDAARARTSDAGRRLDRLPFGRPHLKVLTGSGIGWALDAMDVGLISFIIAALAQQWDLVPGETAWIASIGFIGMAIGASIGGLLADRIGRRQVFALTLLVYGLATGASALVGGLAALLVLRFLVGLGLGAELPVASTYVSEFAPARIRGRVIVILEAFWALGWTAAALIGYLVIPLSDDGWRWAFALGAIPAAYALVVRWGLPESARWLERRGRHQEADEIVATFEAASTRPPAHRRPAPSVSPAPQATTPPKASVRALWQPDLRVRTSALWLVWFCVNFAYYGAFIWIPTLLVAQGFDLVRSFEYTLWITLAQLPGYAVAAWLIEVWGRRATLSVFLIGSAVAALLFGTASTEAMILLTGMALSFFNLG
ncbi:MAG TPA: MFS transporter, partial [Microbacterium sp.]|nr:MFS transporter [Microbacterium sp.]